MARQEFIEEIRAKLHTMLQIDGWLIHDFEGRNRQILDLFGVPRQLSPTRRFFYLVPRRGPCTVFLHKVDEQLASYFPGTIEFYGSWKELSGRLLAYLQAKGTLAMEDWFTELLPSQGILDAATKKWLEDNGKTVVPSWPLVEDFIGKLLPHQKDLLFKAQTILDKAFALSWKIVSERLSQGHPLTELELQEYMVRVIQGEGGICQGKPIVAVGKNSARPHHEATKTIIQPDEILLIDAWCKKDDLRAPYADFTQVAFTGAKAPQRVKEIYETVLSSQRQAVQFVKTCYENGCSIAGAEVDDACRKVIEASSFHGSFIHRTGHNIFLDVHGPGANLDNYETRDTRHLIANGCYSIEPGIYIPQECGIRLECMILLDASRKITTHNEAPPTVQCLS